MDTEFINCGSSKTSVSHRLLFNPFDKINWKRSDKYVASSNLTSYYTWRNTKNSYKDNKLKITVWYGMKSLN